MAAVPPDALKPLPSVVGAFPHPIAGYDAFMFEDTLENVVFRRLPRPCIAAIAAIAMRAAIKPYSIAVAARVSRSRLMKFIMVHSVPV